MRADRPAGTVRGGWLAANHPSWAVAWTARSTDERHHSRQRIAVVAGFGSAFALYATRSGGRVAKKTKSRTAKTKSARPAAKRDLVRKPKASAYAKRTATGRFKEMDDVGRSQRVDKPRRAKTTARSGYGDLGDTRPRKRAAATNAAAGVPGSPQGEGALVRTAGWAGSIAGYASSRVAKGLRAAAATVGLAKTNASGHAGRRARQGNSRAAAKKR